MEKLVLPGPLVTVEWLSSQILGRAPDPRLVILEAVFNTSANSNPPAEVIPGTRIFDYENTVCDQDSPLPNMMPTPDLFMREVRGLGINPDSVIVIYDRAGIFSSPRARWMFKAMGHDSVSVLDGGFPAWQSAGLKCEALSAAAPKAGDFVANPQPGLFCDANQVVTALKSSGCAVVDARSEARFSGRDPEPREGLRAGHIPGTSNLPYAQILSNGKMLPRAELMGLFKSQAGQKQEFVFTCGSGVTACILALGAEIAGYSKLTVYDGSWSEWGLASSQRPVEKS